MRISDWSSDVCSSDLVEADAGQLHVDRLGAQRVGLAVELLAEEVELAADGAALVEQLARRLDVCGQAVELLADVGLAGEHGEFLSEAIFGDTGALLQQQRKLLRQALAQSLRLRSEEHTSELQSLMRISSAVLCL